MTRIGIVTTPSNDESFAEPVYRFATILQPNATALSLFAGGVVARESPLSNTIDLGEGKYLDISLIDYFILQLYISYQVASHRDNLDVIYFHKGSMGLVIPLLLARLLRINTCVIKIGAFHNNRVNKRDRIDDFFTSAQRFMFWLADGAVVFSENEIDSIPNDTVFVGYSEYIDFNKFDIQKSFLERPIDIGFVGRFNEVKGVRQFAKAAVEMIENNPNLEVRIVGDGPQYELVEMQVSDYDQIQLTGWVPHDDIAEEYNRMRTLVAPSKAEGLPSGLIEAMGCGAVVLATPVGSVGDLIIDGETGFHLPNQKPETIVREISQVKTLSDLRRIGENARSHVLSTYSKEAVETQFAKITNSLNDTSTLTTSEVTDE